MPKAGWLIGLTILFIVLLIVVRQEKVPKHKMKRPADWNLTMEDLLKEKEQGKRDSVGQPEINWALEYESSLIPKEYRSPHKGDIYEALQDMEVKYLTAWGAPYTGGGESHLLKGERVKIDPEPNGNPPIATYAIPVEYKKLEERMVPEKDRMSEKYGGFYLFFRTVDLNENFKLIQEE